MEEEEKRFSTKTNAKLNGNGKEIIDQKNNKDRDIRIKKLEEKIRENGENNKGYDAFKYIYSYEENNKKKFLQITNHDKKTLESDQLINDTIINFFLK